MKLPELSDSPTISVVVPARNSGSTLETAVRSALGQEVPGELEVVIAVGPSDDDTQAAAERLAEDERVRIVENRTGTTPVALNTAIAASRGEVVARLDGHAELTAGYLRRAVDLLRETGAANVGGVQLPVPGDGFSGAVAAAMGSAFGSGGARYRTSDEPGPTDTVYLGVFRREALDTVGGYDERLLRNQDYELNHRIRRGGGTVYFHPDLVVRYRPRGAPSTLARQYFAYGAWKRSVIRMHPGSVRLRQLVPPLFVLALIGGAILAVAGGPAWPLAGVSGAYAVAAAGSAVGACDRLRQVPAAIGAYAVMHLGWGAGFLLGRTARPR